MKKHIKLILRTLFSNNACVEAARTKEVKYNIIAIVFVVLALFLAALPTCVTGFQQQGGNILRGTLYDFDTAVQLLKKETDNKVGFKITNKHKLEITGWNDNMKPYDYNEEEPTAESKHPNLHCFIARVPDHDPIDPTKEHKVLEVYVCPSTIKFTKFVSDIANNIDPYIGKLGDKKDEKKWLETEKKIVKKEEKTVLKARSTSFIVFGEKQVQAALYAPGVASAASSVSGDYMNTKATIEGKDFLQELIVKNNDKQTISNFRKFFDQAFINTRNANTWRSTGIILGVDAGVILLMGVMVFILTRGKNNPFRIYSFWDAQKISYYACFTPGILALFGFLMSNMAMMLFILGAGVRVMWLSMRTLRYQAPNKQ